MSWWPAGAVTESHTRPLPLSSSAQWRQCFRPCLGGMSARQVGRWSPHLTTLTPGLSLSLSLSRCIINVTVGLISSQAGPQSYVAAQPSSAPVIFLTFLTGLVALAGGNQTGPGARRDNNNCRHEDTGETGEAGETCNSNHPPHPHPSPSIFATLYILVI